MAFFDILNTEIYIGVSLLGGLVAATKAVRPPIPPSGGQKNLEKCRFPQIMCNMLTNSSKLGFFLRENDYLCTPFTNNGRLPSPQWLAFVSVLLAVTRTMARMRARRTRMRITRLRMRMRTTRRPYTLHEKEKQAINGREPCHWAENYNVRKGAGRAARR